MSLTCCQYDATVFRNSNMDFYGFNCCRYYDFCSCSCPNRGFKTRSHKRQSGKLNCLSATHDMT